VIIGMMMMMIIIIISSDSVVGIAGRFGDLLPVRAGFSAPVRTDPGTHPAS
jgi:hypothetical protein